MKAAIDKARDIWCAVLNTRTSDEGKKILNRIKTPTDIDKYFIYYDEYRIWRGDFMVLKYFGSHTTEVTLNWADKRLIKKSIKIFNNIK